MSTSDPADENANNSGEGGTGEGVAAGISVPDSVRAAIGSNDGSNTELKQQQQLQLQVQEQDEEDFKISEMERLLAQEEEAEGEEVAADDDDGTVGDANGGGVNDRQEQEEAERVDQQEDAGMNNNDNGNGNDAQRRELPPPLLQDQFPQFPQQGQPQPQQRMMGLNTLRPSSFLKSHYTSISITSTILHILYVLRTRKQIYLALMYLTTSRISYILIGNAIITTMVSFYHYTIQYFLGGLRLIESETIVENVRWNITESIFALTMFRQEVSVKMMGMFLVVFWCKCLHWAVELRGGHLRMTEDVFYFLDGESYGNGNTNGGGAMGLDMGMNINMNRTGNGNGNVNDNVNTADVRAGQTTSRSKITLRHLFWTFTTLLLPKSIQQKLSNIYYKAPRVHKTHIMYYILMNVLYTLDLGLIAYTTGELIETGPSSNILFLFDASIMLITIMNSHFLYALHILDGIINMFHNFITDDHDDENDDDEEEGDSNGSGSGNGDAGSEEIVEALEGQSQAHTQTQPQRATQTTQRLNRRNHRRRYQILIGRIASMWRDNRATANFSVELMALAAKFLFHLLLFLVVFATYGLPISIIRDFYVAYLKLRRRLSSFVSYRRLTSNMDKRFKTVECEEDFGGGDGEDSERTCIICRDVMDVDGIHGVCKKLPYCGHVFHKHCLREWLVQQQSCPTCRGDIVANEARAAREEEEERERQRQEEEEEEADELEAESVSEKGEGHDGGDGGDGDVIEKGQNMEDSHDSNYDSKSKGYPILCEVTSAGAVVNFSTIKSSLHEKEGICQNFKRVLHKGTLVVCTDLKVWVWNDLNTNDVDEKQLDGECMPSKVGAGVYLRIPDGWVKQSQVTRLLVLKKKV